MQQRGWEGVCVQSSALRQSPSILSHKCSDFPVAKLTFAEEAPPKPPRLFLMANSKESPADSPVITWANGETFLSWLRFFQGLVLPGCVLWENLGKIKTSSTFLTGRSRKTVLSSMMVNDLCSTASYPFPFGFGDRRNCIL